MKKIIATAILLSTSVITEQAMAHDTSFSSDSCDVELNAGLRINKSAVEFSKNDKILYKIINNEQLFVNGQSIALDSSQQALVTEYSENIRGVLPEVKEIALDAIELAAEGVTLAFDGLLGEDNDLGSELSTQLLTIKDEVDQQFSDNREFYIDEHGEWDGEFFGEDFEQRIEETVEEVVQNSMGTLLIAVGQQMLFSGGDMDAFETRMEDFGEQIEHEMEARGEEIEKRGEALCQSIYQIDELETQLQQQISELSEIDVISAEIDGRNKA